MRLFTVVAAIALALRCVEAAENLNVVDLAKPSEGDAAEKSELVEGAVLSEDDGYWERFLQGQDSMPSAAPTGQPCDVEVVLSCELDDTSRGGDCNNLPTATSPDECEVDMTFTYTIRNIGPTVETINSLTRTITGTVSGTEIDQTLDLTDRLPDLVLDLDETVVATEDATVDVCGDFVLTYSTEVNADPPSGKSCNDDDSVTISVGEIICDVDVELTCATSDGRDCEDIIAPNQVCTASPTAIRFKLTCDNCNTSGNSQDPAIVGCTDFNGGPNFASGPFNVVITDEDGSTISQQSPVSCDEPIELDATSGSTLPDKVTITVSDTQPLQEVTIDTSCDDQPLILGEDFGAVQVTSFTNPVEGESDCEFDIIYTYVVDNVGPTVESINSLTTAINGEETDLTSRLDTLVLEPGDTVETFEALTIDVCEEPEFVASTEVDASPVDDPEKTCDDTDEIVFEPPKACDVEVTLTCEVTLTDDSGAETTVDCDEVPAPESFEDCEKTVTYTYTVDNIGPTTETINTLTVTQGGVTEDCTDDLPTTTLAPGNNVFVEKTLLVNFCPDEAEEVAASATVNASPPPPGKTCEDTDELVFPIEPVECEELELEITCEASIGDEFGEESTIPCVDIPEPEEEDDCEKEVTFTYTIRNDGLTTEEVDNLSITQFGETEDCTDDLETTSIAPGSSTSVEKVVTIDMCPEETETVTTVATVAAVPRDGKECLGEDELEFEIPSPPCDETTLSVRVTCVDEDGENCRRIEQPSNPRPGTCLVDLTYNYEIENTGLADETIRRLRVERDGARNNLADAEGTAVDSGDSVAFTETVETDICQDATVDTVVTVVAVPRDGNECEVTDDFSFTTTFETPPPSNPPTNEPTLNPTNNPSPPPTPSPSDRPSSTPSAPPTGSACEVDVEINCTPIGGVVQDCEGIPPTFTQCLQRPTEMQMRYNGGGCEQSFNLQELDKFGCQDSGGGPPVTPHTANVRVVALKDQSTVYFDGDIDINTEFTLFDQANPGERVEADMLVTVTIDGNVVQLVNFHSSCSQNLFLKDKFGSVQFVGFINEVQGTVSCFVNATFSFVIENTGSLENAELESLIVIRNGEFFDFTDQVRGAFIETGGDPVTIIQPILIDITVRRLYTTSIILTGINPANGVRCEDREDLIFEAGNPVPIGFPAVPTPTTSPT